MEARTEKIILDQIRGGATERFEELVRFHSPSILRLAVRLTGNPAEAEEIVQEAFLRFFEGIGSFRGESRVNTWLYRTVTRLAVDHLRRERIRRRIFFFRREEESTDLAETVPDPSPTPGDQAAARETMSRLNRSLAGMPPRQRAVFILRHQEQMPLKDIAATLDLEMGTVKAHLHRAVVKLRRELAEYRERLP